MFTYPSLIGFFIAFCFLMIEGLFMMAPGEFLGMVAFVIFWMGCVFLILGGLHCFVFVQTIKQCSSDWKTIEEE